MNWRNKTYFKLPAQDCGCNRQAVNDSIHLQWHLQLLHHSRETPVLNPTEQKNFVIERGTENGCSFLCVLVHLLRCKILLLAAVHAQAYLLVLHRDSSQTSECEVGHLFGFTTSHSKHVTSLRYIPCRLCNHKRIAERFKIWKHNIKIYKNLKLFAIQIFSLNRIFLRPQKYWSKFCS